MFKLLGFTGADVCVPPFYKRRAISDRAALKRDLLRLVETPSLTRLVPSHGDVVVSNAPALPRQAAEAYL
jgi:hypothetical protein